MIEQGNNLSVQDQDGSTHTQVPSTKRSKKALDRAQQGSTRPHNLAPRPSADQSGFHGNKQRGSQKSANGQGIPAHAASGKKKSKALRAIERRENNQADANGGYGA